MEFGTGKNHYQYEINLKVRTDSTDEDAIYNQIRDLLSQVHGNLSYTVDLIHYQKEA